MNRALIAQLGERQTEDLKALCSIHSQGTFRFASVANKRMIIVVKLLLARFSSIDCFNFILFLR